ncbi:hypothetical protein KC19_2G044800 [Ceratodon purpureus]|uniref:Secreted protein n=1 Tax=Ceratodon purpureus TaxID=3225 RepID=A0A8T0IS68_CERPU|nr:hypothetical protein KC19_2G044800 [Ceratodon purpureus]
MELTEVFAGVSASLHLCIGGCLAASISSGACEQVSGVSSERYSLSLVPTIRVESNGVFWRLLERESGTQGGGSEMQAIATSDGETNYNSTCLVFTNSSPSSRA